MSGRWFKASTRWHLAGDFDRSLCGRFEVPESTQPDMGGRPCAPCSEADVRRQEEDARAAYEASLAPAKPVSEYERPLEPWEREQARQMGAVAAARTEAARNLNKPTKETPMHAEDESLTVYADIEQRSEEWYEARCGIVTASMVGKLLAATSPDALGFDCPECQAVDGEPCLGVRGQPLKSMHGQRTDAAKSAPKVITLADNDTARAITLSLAAERITGHVEETFTSSAMFRGILEEPLARDFYSEHRAPAVEVGFMVRNGRWGALGYSPDGLVGDDGLIEIKSRNQKVQVGTVLSDEVPAENMAQIQAGLLVSGRAWCDYVSYSSGMPMWVIRVYPNADWQAAIKLAVTRYEETATELAEQYMEATRGLPIAPRTPDYHEEIV